MHIREIGWVEWLGIIFFSVVHPWAFVVAVIIYFFWGLSRPVAFLAFLLLSVIFCLVMLIWKHRRWGKVTTEPTNTFLHAAFWSYLWYLPFALLTFSIVGASSNSIREGGGDVLALVLFPLYFIAVCVLVSLSYLTFSKILKKHIQSQTLPPNADGRKVAAGLQNRIYVGVATIVIVIGWLGFSFYKNYNDNRTVPAGLFGPTTASIPSGFHMNNNPHAWFHSLTDAGYDWAYSNKTVEQVQAMLNNSTPVTDFRSMDFSEDAFSPYRPPTDPSSFAFRIDPRYTATNAPAELLAKIHSQTFTFEGTTGVVFSYPVEAYHSGPSDYFNLFWNDGGKELKIEVVAPEGQLSMQQVIDILGTMKRY